MFSESLLYSDLQEKTESGGQRDDEWIRRMILMNGILVTLQTFNDKRIRPRGKKYKQKINKEINHRTKNTFSANKRHDISKAKKSLSLLKLEKENDINVIYICLRIL